MRQHRIRARVARCLAAVVLAPALLSGCATGGFNGVYGMPLPGGADLGDHPYRIRIQFADVLDLVPQAGVKVDDVPVGKVESIDVGADGWYAEVTVLVNGDVKLPADARASIRQSSLLGEKFVQLDIPSGSRNSGRLAENMVIPLERSNRNTEVEEVFGAMSLLLNGGGVAQAQSIVRELNVAMAGNEDDIRSFLSEMDTFVGEMDNHKAEIVRALDSVQRLSGTLSGQKEQIGGVLDGMGPGVQVLAEQREALVEMLRSLDRLSGIATDTINKTKDDLVADLHAMAPTLRQLADAGRALPESLELLFTFPFSDAVIDAVRGDYLNSYLDMQVHTAPPANPASATDPVLPLPSVDGGRG
jgi:phospholipid/cholesterol/gamma-HCH transport system substrate-binding protein